jgi:hypothetical protein
MTAVVVVVVVAVAACTTKVLAFLQPSSPSVVVAHEIDEQANAVVGFAIGPIPVFTASVNADVSALQ